MVVRYSELQDSGLADYAFTLQTSNLAKKFHFFAGNRLFSVVMISEKLVIHFFELQNRGSLSSQYAQKLGFFCC